MAQRANKQTGWRKFWKSKEKVAWLLAALSGAGNGCRFMVNERLAAGFYAFF